MILLTGAVNQTISTVVLLSPGLDYARVSIRSPMEYYGYRPLLIVANEMDAYAANSSRELLLSAVGEAELIMYQGSRHGTQTVTRKPGLGDLIIDWLNDHLQ
jgi:hypothetical protein